MLDKWLYDKSTTSRNWLAWWIHNQIRHRLPKCHYANVKLNPLVFCLHKLVTLFSRKFLADNESRKQRNKISQIKSKRRYQAGSSQKSALIAVVESSSISPAFHVTRPYRGRSHRRPSKHVSKSFCLHSLESAHFIAPDITEMKELFKDQLEESSKRSYLPLFANALVTFNFKLTPNDGRRLVKFLTLTSVTDIFFGVIGEPPRNNRRENWLEKSSKVTCQEPPACALRSEDVLLLPFLFVLT